MHGLPKVVTWEVLDGDVNRPKDRIVTQPRWRHSRSAHLMFWFLV